MRADSKPQSIGEPGTQLTMRTFHIGGVAQGGQQSFLEASQDGLISYENPMILKNSSGSTLVVGRNMKLRIVDEQGNERASHKLSYGSKIFLKEGAKVARGDKLFHFPAHQQFAVSYFDQQPKSTLTSS